MKLFLPLFLLCSLNAAALELPVRINAGGPAISKPGKSDHWFAGSDFVKGGADFRFKGEHDRSAIKNPAPNEVYETVRHQDHRYEIPGLPAGNYRVRFHFTEGFNSGDRAMDYYLNGKKVIDNLNVLAAADGVKRAHIIEAAVTLKGGENLVIDANQDKGNDVFEAGIEILALAKGETPPPAITTSPKPKANTKLDRFLGSDGRFVWLQGGKWQHSTDKKSSVKLMGLDTKDGSERAILPSAGAYAKPLFSSDGKRVVFTDLAKRKVMMVDFSGQKLVDLGSGFASDVWRDPKTKSDWVYLRAGSSGTKSKIVRRRLDDPKKEELVWDKSENGHASIPWFQLSGDGRVFSDAFPWSTCGVGDTRKKSWKKNGRGCWPSISPDDSHRMFIFSSSHLDVALFDGSKQRTVKVNTMPGVSGKKVYFPRWSNHPRYITVVGPERDARA
ncbi:MAG: hypothetical protein HKN23_05080, partial [Verrucomicrobiales bacterium]|nr:hypothetical protein [Verrucomicrobiales bacterium]